jgi:hypothetical protein
LRGHAVILEGVVQPVKDLLAHEAAVLHDAVVGSPLRGGSDDQRFPRAGQAVPVLSFDLGTPVLAAVENASPISQPWLTVEPSTSEPNTKSMAGSLKRNLVCAAWGSTAPSDACARAVYTPAAGHIAPWRLTSKARAKSRHDTPDTRLSIVLSRPFIVAPRPARPTG